MQPENFAVIFFLYILVLFVSFQFTPDVEAVMQLFVVHTEVIGMVNGSSVLKGFYLEECSL